MPADDETTSAGAIIAQELAEWAVLPSVIYPRNYEEFLSSPRRLCVLAGAPLDRCEQLVSELAGNGQLTLLNLDFSFGLGRDDAALAYLKRIGVAGILTTRIGTVQKARSLGFFTVQATFFTDGTTVGKGIAAARSANPHLVQVMPSPVVAHLSDEERKGLGSFLVAGFVRTPEDVADALRQGATAATATSPSLWRLSRHDVPR